MWVLAYDEFSTRFSISESAWPSYGYAVQSHFSIILFAFKQSSHQNFLYIRIIPILALYLYPMVQPSYEF